MLQEKLANKGKTSGQWDKFIKYHELYKIWDQVVFFSIEKNQFKEIREYDSLFSIIINPPRENVRFIEKYYKNEIPENEFYKEFIDRMVYKLYNYFFDFLRSSLEYTIIRKHFEMYSLNNNYKNINKSFKILFRNQLLKNYSYEFIRNNYFDGEWVDMYLNRFERVVVHEIRNKVNHDKKYDKILREIFNEIEKSLFISIRTILELYLFYRGYKKIFKDYDIELKLVDFSYIALYLCNEVNDLTFEFMVPNLNFNKYIRFSEFLRILISSKKTSFMIKNVLEIDKNKYKEAEEKVKQIHKITTEFNKIFK